MNTNKTAKKLLKMDYKVLSNKRRKLVPFLILGAFLVNDAIILPIALTQCHPETSNASTGFPDFKIIVNSTDNSLDQPEDFVGDLFECKTDLPSEYTLDWSWHIRDIIDYKDYSNHFQMTGCELGIKESLPIGKYVLNLLCTASLGDKSKTVEYLPSSSLTLDITRRYNILGTNWEGRLLGKVECQLNKDDHTASVRYGGKNDGKYESYNLVIPNKVWDDDGEGYLVTTIGQSAFASNVNVKGTLTLPKYLTKVDSSAFDGCSGLKGSLILPNTLIIINASAFQNCTNLTGDLAIPDSVTYIGASSFYGCGFQNLTIGCGVDSIQSSAFRNCTKLTGHLKIPNNITRISDYVINNCDFTTITFGTGLTYVGICAFQENKNASLINLFSVRSATTTFNGGCFVNFGANAGTGTIKVVEGSGWEQYDFSITNMDFNIWSISETLDPDMN